jgi:hypothetical protein
MVATGFSNSKNNNNIGHEPVDQDYVSQARSVEPLISIARQTKYHCQLT